MALLWHPANRQDFAWHPGYLWATRRHWPCGTAIFVADYNFLYSVHVFRIPFQHFAPAIQDGPYALAVYDLLGIYRFGRWFRTKFHSPDRATSSTGDVRVLHQSGFYTGHRKLVYNAGARVAVSGVPERKRWVWRNLQPDSLRHWLCPIPPTGFRSMVSTLLLPPRFPILCVSEGSRVYHFRTRSR